MPDGRVPTGKVVVIVREATLMTDTSFAPMSGTNAIVPSGDMAIADGWLPT